MSHTVTDQSKLACYTDSSSEEEDLYVDINFYEPIDFVTLSLISFLF